jgi:hypothetical protein
VSQEDHLEFHWLPFDQLADTDVRPGRSSTHSWPPETTARRSGTAGTVERAAARRMREREAP